MPSSYTNVNIDVGFILVAGVYFIEEDEVEEKTTRTYSNRLYSVFKNAYALSELMSQTHAVCAHIISTYSDMHMF